MTTLSEEKTKESSSSNSNNKPQWIEISELSSFSTKWSLFASFQQSFGNVLKVEINGNKRSAKILFSNIESAQKCVNYYTSNPVLDGERIGIDLSSETNITQRNAQKCTAILHKKLNGYSYMKFANKFSNHKSVIEKIKFCAENLEILTPFHISTFHSKILRLLTQSSANPNKAIFVTNAFEIIGIDSFCFSDEFHTVNALCLNEIFYANLVSNLKLFGRYGTPIKCFNLCFEEMITSKNLTNSIHSHIIYIDAFALNKSLKWNDCLCDISFGNSNNKCLSQLCHSIGTHNGNGTETMLIAVKVPKHFMIADFYEKVSDLCQIIAFDFRVHQLMVLDLRQNISELRALQFKCQQSMKKLGFIKCFIFQNCNGSDCDSDCEPSLKKRKLSQTINTQRPSTVSVADIIAQRVKTELTALGFKHFGNEYLSNFRQKLKVQIYSKQLIRERINEMDLKSEFAQINGNEISKEFIKSDTSQMHWICPHIIGPRYLIYACAQWLILVDSDQNMSFHPSFNHFYQNIFFGTNSFSKEQSLKTVSVIDGFLIPSNYFETDTNKRNNNKSVPRLQFWILDILSFRNDTSVVLRDRFHYFTNIVRAYNKEWKCANNNNQNQNKTNIPMSIHSLHFEEYSNLNNLLKFVKLSSQNNSDHYKQGFVYANNEGCQYCIDGFVVIKNNNPCVIHDRNKYSDKCVLWKCNFNSLLTQYFIHKRKQTTNTAMFQM